MKITTDSIKVENRTYSATKIDIDEIQIIKKKNVVKKHIVDKTLETCDDGMLVERYKDICDFNIPSDNEDIIENDYYIISGKKIKFLTNHVQVLNNVAIFKNCTNIQNKKMELKYEH